MNPLVVTEDDALPIASQSEVAIIKMHGDINHPSRMVVTEGDYDLFIDRNPLLCTYISSLFISRTLLLIGYSLDDNDMRQLLKIVQSRLGKMTRPIYAIQVDATPITIDKFKRRGVEVINLKRNDKSVKSVVIDFLKQLKAYKEATSQCLVTSDKEDSKEQLFLPPQENKLCFVSCAQNRVAQLREILEPVIIRAGGVPLWSGDIITSGVEVKAAIDSAVKRSRVRIFDLTDVHKYVSEGMTVSCYDDSKKTILIKEARDNLDKLSDNSTTKDGRVILYYHLDMVECDADVMSGGSAFTNKLEEAIRKLIGFESLPSLGSARRLLGAGEYGAAVVSAWIALETQICDRRMDFDTKVMSLNKLAGTIENRKVLSLLRRLRNEVVHGVRFAKKEDAVFAISHIERLLSNK